MTKQRKTILTLVLKATLFFFCFATAHADAAQGVGYAARGATKVISGVFAIPRSMIEDSGRLMFPLGILTGAVRGSVQTVAATLGGTFDMVRGAAPYAKYLIFL